MATLPRQTVLYGRHYVWTFTGGCWSLVPDRAADERAVRLDAATARLVDALQRGRRDERPTPDTRPVQPDPEPVTVDPEPVPA